MAYQLRVVGVAGRDFQDPLDRRCVQSIMVPGGLGYKLTGSFRFEERDPMVQRNAEDEGVVFSHFLEPTAQRENKVQPCVMLHEMPKVVEDLTLESSRPHFLVEAHYLVHHQDQMVVPQS